jgi:hypothetical protein
LFKDFIRIHYLFIMCFVNLMSTGGSAILLLPRFIYDMLFAFLRPPLISDMNKRKAFPVEAVQQQTGRFKPDHKLRWPFRCEQSFGALIEPENVRLPPFFMTDTQPTI